MANHETNVLQLVRDALHLLINGAMREIDAQTKMADNATAKDVFNTIRDVLAQWED